MMSYEDKIKKAISEPQAAGLPSTAPLMAMLLSGYRPLNPPAGSIDNMTSTDIAAYFDDICPVSTADISAVMLYLGYSLYCHISGMEWSMQRVANQTY